MLLHQSLVIRTCLSTPTPTPSPACIISVATATTAATATTTIATIHVSNSTRSMLNTTRAHTMQHTLNTAQRILEVLGLLVLVGFCGFFFAWAAGTCIDLPEDW